MRKTSDLLARVIEAIVVVTRYPREVLAPTADLENDLGIDSVKLVEILVALGREFNIDLMKQERDSAIRSIQQVADWIEGLLTQTGDAPPASAQAPPLPLTDRKGAALDGTVPTSTPPTETTPLSGQATPLAQHRPQTETTNGQTQHGQVRHGQLQHGQAPHSRAQQADNQHIQALSGNGTIARHSPPHASPPRRHAAIAAKPMAEPPEAPMPAQPLSLRGRVALVTGSGRGVGRTIARLLAKRGATVIVNSFHSREAGEQTAAEIIDQGGQALQVWGSVANPAHVDNIFDEITHRIGQLDILVCNASDGRIGSFAEVSPEDWERAFRTNVIGHHQCAMRASRLMQRQGGGAIVTMSSIAARRYVEGLGGQGVVKAAVESLTRHLACELAPWGIRTNCVAGGPVYGQVMSLYPDARSTMNYWETLVSDGELCSPLDLALTVAFLVSDEARGVNGAIWNVDHGLSTRSHSRPLPKPMHDSLRASVLS